MLKDDTLANVLYIDLTKKHFVVRRREDLFEKYLGGAGVAIQLLHEECPEGADPYGPDNPIVLAVGPLTGSFPLASKTVAMFKSPHTGNLGESHCGGRSAVAIRMAGYGAIVIRGASDAPLYLAINDGQVNFRDATSLWGMSNNVTVGRIIREKEPGSGMRTIMRIGRAGENLVSYACVTTETYRHFGRLGLGAVFGSKKLKAVMISGKHSLPLKDMAAYKKLYGEIHETATASPLMKKYHDIGTADNVTPLNEMGSLPTRNLKETRFDGAANITGSALAENFLGRRLACSHCPVGCIHIAALREPHENEPYFYKTSMISYDYELIFSLGSMLGISDAPGLLKLMDIVEALGLDAMSIGVVLSWATEAQERSVITKRQTKGLNLAWGDYETYMKAVKLVVEQPNGFYRALARGVEHASKVYGGEEYALSFGGNEMPGYHTGPATHIGVLAGARHSHLDNGGYSLDQKMMKDRPLPEDLAEKILKEERWRQILSSLVVCFFARGLYTPEVITSALELTGFYLGPRDLDTIGARIHREKFRFKVREGFSLDDVRIPARVFETASPAGGFDEAFIRQSLDCIKGALVRHGSKPKEPADARQA